ncbi:hypothetical protein ACFXOM_19295 [Streptomyces sp. NPDC059169]|uniref:MmyB family transcriptional regulator n=1 Tax=Streptomyces sp. NPDC059169 TaxID=3346754 RepID=UPI0036BC9556
MPNAPWALFTTPGPGCPLVSREGELPVMVATRCDAYGRYPGEHPWETFVRRLSATCPEYAALWEGGRRAARSPDKGLPPRSGGREARRASLSPAVNGMPECRIVPYTPNDAESRRRAEWLSELRAATG